MCAAPMCSDKLNDYYEPIQYVVADAESGMQLRTILQRKMCVSRSLMSRLKLTVWGISVNGQRQYINVNVQAGDLVEVRMEQEESDDILPQDIPVEVIFEDDQLLIVNKPSGLIVHPTHGHYTDTLANGVVHYWRSRGERRRFRPIHRLDQDTSGVLAIAKTAYAHQYVSEQLKAGTVSKRYTAFVHGHPPEPSGTIDRPIDRSTEQPHLRTVREDGYAAITHYLVMHQFEAGAELSIRLETGRTHQIRVHLSATGCPLIGDKLYFTAASELAEIRMAEWVDRHALHAAQLGFEHPITKQPMIWEAPLPGDLSRLRSLLAGESKTAQPTKGTTT